MLAKWQLLRGQEAIGTRLEVNPGGGTDAGTLFARNSMAKQGRHLN